MIGRRSEMMTVQLAEGSRLKLVGSHGFKQPFLDFFDVVTDDDACACGRATGSKRQILVSDTSTSPIFHGQSRRAIEAAGVRSVISTPMITRDDRLIGMLSIHRRIPWYPSSEEMRQINTLCNDLARQMARR